MQKTLINNVKTLINVELLNNFIKLTVVNALKVEKDIVNILEQKLFLQKQIT